MSAACSETRVAPVFVTERLMVRRYVAADMLDHLRLRADPEVRRFMHWGEDDPAARFAEDAERAIPDGRGWVNLAVARREDGRLLGDHGLKVEGGSAWLGLALLPEARRRGYGAELVSGAVGWLRELGVGRCVAEIDFGNAASFALFLRLGFRVAAEKRDDFGPFSVLVNA
jgi:RimJ/RimL family protein N-acetyltransferase